MEMLKKVVIVLAIAGSCGVQAAVGGYQLLNQDSSSDTSSLVSELRQQDFYDKSVAEI